MAKLTPLLRYFTFFTRAIKDIQGWCLTNTSFNTNTILSDQGSSLTQFLVQEQMLSCMDNTYEISDFFMNFDYWDDFCVNDPFLLLDPFGTLLCSVTELQRHKISYKLKSFIKFERILEEISIKSGNTDLSIKTLRLFDQHLKKPLKILKI